MTIVQRSFTRVEPSLMMDGDFGHDPYGHFYLTDLFGPTFPAWMPQQFKIVRARIGHQGEPSQLKGQVFYGVDHFRHGYRGGLSYQNGYEEGENSRWTLLASLWLDDPNRERMFYYAPPVAVDRAVDSIWVRRGGGVGGVCDQMWWQIGIEYDDAGAEWTGYVPQTIVKWAEVLDQESGPWNGYCVRLIIPAAVIHGNFSLAAFGMEAPRGESLVISTAYLGRRATSGNSWDFAATPTALGSLTIPAGERGSFGDQPFTYTGGDLVLSYVIGNNGSGSNARVKVGSAGVSRHIKADGAADVATLNPSGFDANAGNNIALAWVATG